MDFSKEWLKQKPEWKKVPEGAVIYDRWAKKAALYQQGHWLEIVQTDMPIDTEDFPEVVHIN